MSTEKTFFDRFGQGAINFPAPQSIEDPICEWCGEEFEEDGDSVLCPECKAKLEELASEDEED